MKSKVFELIELEEKRQNETIELIASENFVSENVKKAVGSCLTNKYAEGYPNHRYYGGCKYVDKIEEYCQQKWKEVFNTDYHVNVQPHSGSQANMAAYMAVLKPEDVILSMSLEEGGHLSHGSSVNFSGKLYRVDHYDCYKNGEINYDDIYFKMLSTRPNLILIGASAYPRKIDFKRIYNIINEAKEEIKFKDFIRFGSNYKSDYNPIFMVDMAHIAGLIATGEHPSPFGYADIITTTTHKTLRGPRGGLIFCKPELAKKIDSAIFPGIQGGPLMHVIAGKAVAAEEALTPQFKIYIHDVVENCKAMAKVFIKKGLKLVTGGTENHLLLIDLFATHPYVSGLMLQEKLDEMGITLNKNMIPNDPRSPKETSGVRIGTAAMTTKGYRKEQFEEIANTIVETINKLNVEYSRFSKEI